MLQTTPFLLFDGNCAEAMTFYHQCLGGELTLTKLGDTPMKAQFPPEKHNRMINAHVKTGNTGSNKTCWATSHPHLLDVRPSTPWLSMRPIVDETNSVDLPEKRVAA